MKWAEIIIKTTTQGADIMAGILYEAGVKGAIIEDPADIVICQNDEKFWDYIDGDIARRMDTQVLVKGYLPLDERLADAIVLVHAKVNELKTFSDLGFDMGTGQIVTGTVEDKDWENAWKRYYKPLKISDKIVIKPSWESYQSKENEVVVPLDPGMAFGTGTHETTQMSVQLLEKYIHMGNQVIDVGCGTGVLAICAVLLGAGSAIAIDLDPVAVKVAKENVALNHLTEKIKVIEGNLLIHINEKADVLVANIVADAILSLSKPVLGHLKDGGIFISSGIIKDRLLEVEQRLQQDGYQILEKMTMGEWVAIACKRGK